MVPSDQASAKVSERALRMKSAMILYHIENLLGDFVYERKSALSRKSLSIVDRIRDREENRGRTISDDDVMEVVSASYFEEILNIALAAVNNRPEENQLKRLKSLFEDLKIFSIRNAIAHPNRPFPVLYWHRVAAVALDPALSALGFESVQQTYEVAESGALIPPPENWINAPAWFVPNNLPDVLDHDITGLIGRSQETRKLLRRLKNPRYSLVAIVSPGGIGKTALLLQVLKELTFEPTSVEWVDLIFYFSAKRRFLTSDGLIERSPGVETIAELRSDLVDFLSLHEPTDAKQYNSYEEAVSANADRRILLCLDNLETILRDDPENFETFYSELPENWDVVVTSRVLVDAATVISLDPLDSKGAKSLAQTYLSRRGGQPLNEDTIEELVDSCDCNPLAIRLSLDAYVLGGDIGSSIAATKGQVLEFSYERLIQTLSPEARMAIECLFLSSEPLTRTEMKILIAKSVDDVAGALAELHKTSLISRHSSGSEELYTLSSSVRDFLLLSPIDPAARKIIDRRIRRAKAAGGEVTRMLRHQDVSPLSWRYIPEDLAEPAKVLAQTAIRELRQEPLDRKSVLISLEKIRQVLDGEPEIAALRRIVGIGLSRLGDRVAGQRELAEACKGSSYDPAAAVFLSKQYRDSQQLSEAVEIAKKLLDDEWDDPTRSNATLAGMVISNYCLPLIWLGDVNEVIELTRDWRNSGVLRSVQGCLHSSAWRKLVEYEDDISSIAQALMQCLDVLEELFRKEGYPGLVVVEASKVMEQLVWAANGRTTLSQDAVRIFTRFMDNHLEQVCAVHFDLELDSDKVKGWIQDLTKPPYDIEDNALLDEHWIKICQDATSDDEAKLQEPLKVEVTVYSRPTAFPDGKNKSFLFARDAQGNNYFIHRSTVDEIDDDTWEAILVGHRFAVAPGVRPPEESAIPAQSATLLDV